MSVADEARRTALRGRSGRAAAQRAWEFVARGEGRWLVALVTAFLALYFVPADSPRFGDATRESLAMAHEYAREHVLLCLVPAFFIAGAISVFVSQASVLRYLGPRAPKLLAYGVASVSGTLLAVCSCTVLPLFAGIYQMGAGLGPASAFLYSGPAINALAMILTARILGLEFGIARAVGAVVFSLVVGLAMHLAFRRDEERKAAAAAAMPGSAAPRPLWQSALFFFTLVAILVFSNWSASPDASVVFLAVHAMKWWLAGSAAVLLAVLLVAMVGVRPGAVLAAAVPVVALAALFPGQPLVPFVAGIVALVVVLSGAPEESEARQWLDATWGFAKQVTPLLFVGVLLAGFLLGRPGHEALIPGRWIAEAVGGNSPAANVFAASAGALMYFATLTEVPILQGLLGMGMGKGPALALLLAGPALSLPSMIVLRSIMGTKRTLVFLFLVVVLSAATGWLFGVLF